LARLEDASAVVRLTSPAVTLPLPMAALPEAARHKCTQQCMPAPEGMPDLDAPNLSSCVGEYTPSRTHTKKQPEMVVHRRRARLPRGCCPRTVVAGSLLGLLGCFRPLLEHLALVAKYARLYYFFVISLGLGVSKPKRSIRRYRYNMIV
jgi:hypothetical protein